MNQHYKKLADYMDQLIQDHQNSYVSFDDLTESDQQELMTHYIEYVDRDVLDLFDEGFTSELIKFFKSKNYADSREDFCEAITKKSAKYFSKPIQELLDDRAEWLISEDLMLHECHVDQVNGELTWYPPLNSAVGE